MGKASNAKRGRVSAPTSTAGRRRDLPLPWITAGVIVVILGIIVIAFSRDSSDDVQPIANQDHWHAPIGFNVCGEWLSNAPEFSLQAGSSSLRAGVHSHGDGLMHIHPFVSAESGNNATVETWMEYGGWSVSEDSFNVWDGQSVQNGDPCPDGPGTVVWTVNGEVRQGNPSDYKPADLDVIAIGFLAEGAELGEPPSAETIPTDLPGATQPGHDPEADDAADPSDAGESGVDAGETESTGESETSEETVSE